MGSVRRPSGTEQPFGCTCDAPAARQKRVATSLTASHRAAPSHSLACAAMPVHRITYPLHRVRSSRRRAWTMLLDNVGRFLNPVSPDWFSSPTFHFGGVPDALELKICYAPWLRWVLLDRILLRSAGTRIRELCHSEGFLLDSIQIVDAGVIRSDDVRSGSRVLVAHAQRAEALARETQPAKPLLCHVTADLDVLGFRMSIHHGCRRSAKPS